MKLGKSVTTLGYFMRKPVTAQCRKI